MKWIFRLKEDAEIYKPRECPNYSDPGYFSIKLFYGGAWSENPKKYEGGSIAYVDFCNVDEINLVEIYTMVYECGGVGDVTVWYNAPSTDLESGLVELGSHEDVMIMCNLLPKCKYVEVYATCIPQLSQEITLENPQDFRIERIQVDFIDDEPENTHEFEQITKRKLEEEKESKDLFGLDKDFSDQRDYSLEYGSESGSDERFYSEHSNLDESDDDQILQATEPRPLPANVKIQTDRSKKKRSRKNGIPTDLTKLVRKNTKKNCKYCKASCHNSRTCQDKRLNEVKNKGVDLASIKVKGQVQCKSCKQIGHNSRTCTMKNADHNTTEDGTNVNEVTNASVGTNVKDGGQSSAQGNESTSSRKLTKLTVRKRVRKIVQHESINEGSTSGGQAGAPAETYT